VGAHKRIVVIDDNIDTLVLIHAILSKDYEIATINTPKEAAEFVKKINPNLVLLDLMMPELGGWDVYNQIRSDELTADIPVIIMTASGETLDRVFALHIAHVEHYLSKPFSPDELLSCVAKTLENHSPD